MSLSVQADTDRLTVLRAKLKARDGKPGFGENVEELKREIAELEAKTGV